MQLSHGLVGGEKDKFYEDLEVRDHRVPRDQNDGGGAQVQRCPKSAFRFAPLFRGIDQKHLLW